MVRGSNTLLSQETGQALLHSPQVKHAAALAALLLLKSSFELLSVDLKQIDRRDSLTGVRSQSHHWRSEIDFNFPWNELTTAWLRTR
jgi:hypothetical protein